MAFRKVTTPKRTSESPLTLFNDLRPRKIAALYDQQATLLRKYEQEAKDKSDVAIQGATGSGKTLVGILIAEWRRRGGERSLYLCPTRQLAYQVANFCNEQLGIPSFAFVGKKNEFPQKEKSEWRSGDILGVSTYSALFNTSPFFTNPQFLVLDDAHSADQYISDFWSVHVRKAVPEEAQIFLQLTALLTECLPADDIQRVREEPTGIADRMWTQIVPAPLLWEKTDEIRSILSSAKRGSEISFRAETLNSNINSCQFYASPHEILIRPVLPPTSSHAPFAGAKQRLYMSATLGRGGELERLSGRSKIYRLPSPPGWNGQGVGRRFFLFPGSTLDEKSTEILAEKLIDRAGRAFILTNDDRSANILRTKLSISLPKHRQFSISDIEESRNAFINSEKSVIIAANRYDGIDFPGDDCRLLLIYGRPTGANLHEKFLADRLGARALFGERVRTRIIQAFGRCTRSATDYAIVAVLGSHLLDELLVSETQEQFDREFQAEIIFGREQSKDNDIDGLLEMADDFLLQSTAWRDAESEITDIRENLTEIEPPFLDALEKSAEHEIDYINSLWRGNYDDAFASADKVVVALSGGEALRGYHAMWHYLAGCAAQMAHEHGSGIPLEKANSCYDLAKRTANIAWLVKLGVYIHA